MSHDQDRTSIVDSEEPGAPAQISMKIRRFHVTPNLPERLQLLARIVENLWWCWNPDAIDLFRRLDNDLWRRTNHNPAEMLGLVTSQQYQLLLQELVPLLRKVPNHR